MNFINLRTLLFTLLMNVKQHRELETISAINKIPRQTFFGLLKCHIETIDEIHPQLIYITQSTIPLIYVNIEQSAFLYWQFCVTQPNLSKNNP